MSVIGSNILAGAAGQGGDYTIEESLRFNASQSSYLSWTPASAGNRKTWTWSGWVKRGSLGAVNRIFSADDGSASTDQDYNSFFFNSSDQLQFGGNLTNFRITSSVYRDSSAWYHIVFATDTTQATAANRFKLYVNGSEVTSFGTSNNPSQNTDLAVNAAIGHFIGSIAGASYFDGYITEVNFIDGQALDASSFGEFDGATGVWKPKGYTGTYGTNGFYLPMKLDNTTEGFNTVTWVGNGVANTKISGVGFSPDLIWMKQRTGANVHQLTDSVRGALKGLSSNLTDAENTFDSVRAFDTDGFTIGTSAATNSSGQSYVAWCWDAGNTTVSNTDGSITSSVRANPTYGFSVVSYTGTGAAASVGHGLGATPSIVIIKDRDAVTSWLVIDNIVSTAGYTILQATDARATLGAGWAPDSTKINLDSASAQINTSGRNYISYCFSEVSGYSKFGSYTGTGASGNVVTTGFKPAFVMMKCSNRADDWIIFDTTRGTVNGGSKWLLANTSGAETGPYVTPDVTDTGFILQSGSGATNASGDTYIYMAFKDTREYAFWLDDSGNNNDWQPNGGITTSSTVTDTPTPYLGGGNYAVLNPLNSQATVTNGNLTVSKATSGQSFNFATQSIRVPTYFEVSLGTFTGTNNVYWGVGSKGAVNDYTVYFGNNSFAWSLGVLNGTSVYATNNNVQTTITTTSNISSDVWMCAVNPTTGKIWWGKNGSWFSSGSPSTDANPMFSGLPSELFVCFDVNGASSTQTASPNFGQRPFAYTPPTGFKALHTGNLPDSTIVDGSKYFNTVLYTGNGTSQSVTGVGFQPSLLWLKSRSSALWHYLQDEVRGANKTLNSNTTNAENPNWTGHSFDADGFTVDTAYSSETNSSGASYVAWNWKANGTGVSNTDGSITSTVSANPTAGFSIVSYTGTGANATVGHGLGAAPAMLIIKNRDDVGNWMVWHQSDPDDLGYLNLTNSIAGTGRLSWAMNNTQPTSSVFTVTGDINTGGSADKYVAYCFAEVEGYSKFGSYTGNGSADGPFVYTGFKPRYLMVKRTDSTSDWRIIDTSRDTYNASIYILRAQDSIAEGGSLVGDILSNGFKIRSTDAQLNASGGTYIYMAFAETDFAHALAR